MARNGFVTRMGHGLDVDMEFNGIIGAQGFFQDDDFVDPPQVLKFLRDMGEVDTLRIFFNSPGGDAFAGFQIGNRLEKLIEDGQIKNYEAHAEGLVASAATIPYLRASRRIMRNGARFMIHKPHAFGGGTAQDLREQAERLDATEEEAIDLYQANSNLSREEIADFMEKETFFTPKEAETAGFATEIVEPFAIAACMSDQLRQSFKSLPDDLEVMRPLRTTPEGEKLLGKLADEVAKQRIARQAALHPSNW